LGISNAVLAKALPDKMIISLGLFVFPAILIEVLTLARIRMASVSEKLAGG
jgi:hypothetical protein